MRVSRHREGIGSRRLCCRKFAFPVRCLLIMVCFAAGGLSSTVAESGDQPSVVFLRIVESEAPPWGWRASFYYFEKDGLFQKGLEQDDRVRLHEVTVPDLWNCIRSSIPSGSLSEAVVPRYLSGQGVDISLGKSLHVWVRFGADGWRGWTGLEDLADPDVRAFSARLQELARNLAFTGLLNKAEMSPVAGCLRAEVLDRPTFLQFERDGLFVDLTADSGGPGLRSALANPFRTVPVADGSNPFSPLVQELVWGQTVIEGRLGALHVQGRSWRWEME